MKVEVIQSAQNPKIKWASSLRQGKGRKEHRCFLVEGLRECLRAVAGGFVLRSVFFEDKDAQDAQALQSQGVHSSLPAPQFFSISEIAMAKLRLRESGAGAIVAAFESKTFDQPFALSERPLVLICDAMEKPGNVGAMMRTADATGVDGVILSGEHADPLNPHVVRASQGAVFHLPLWCCTPEQAWELLLAKGVTVVAADPYADLDYCQYNFGKATALVIGSESDGLSPFWRQASQTLLKIEMAGASDSLNASVSAAVMLFEAMRQRGL